MTSESTAGFVDAEGNPIDALRWADLHRDGEYWLLAEDTADPVIVQAVWYGSNDPTDDMRPFGVTLSVRQRDVVHTIEVATYPDRATALTAHKTIVAALHTAKTTLTYTTALQEILCPRHTSHQ